MSAVAEVNITNISLPLHNAEKCCARCGEDKPLDKFYPQPGGRHGRKGRCKDCICAQKRIERRRKTEAKRRHADQHPEIRLAKTADRFWGKVVWNGDENECWTWQAALSHDGYGCFVTGGRHFPAHRFAYELLVGPIPAVRHCVNPAHLEPVTRRENLLRGNTIQARNAAKTHCPQGHPYSGDNLYVDARGCRSCWTCKRANRRRYAEAKANA